jgi:hypothetical protein
MSSRHAKFTLSYIKIISIISHLVKYRDNVVKISPRNMASFINAGISAAMLCHAVTPAHAQIVTLPSGAAQGVAVGYGVPNGPYTAVDATTPLPVAAKQENIAMATANSVAAPASVYGGSYIFSQSCAAYDGGNLTLRYRGPDGVTMMAMMSKTVADTDGGTLVTLGSNASVDVLLPSGATGCNATLSRVP